MAGEEQPVPQDGSAPPGPPPKKQSRFKNWLHGKNGWFARFARQDLHGFTPIISSRFVILVYLIAGVILLPLGIAILVASLNVQEHKVRYDNQGAFAGLSSAQREAKLQNAGTTGLQVPLILTIEKNMDPPIYVYYDLDSYYQNYRRYVRSLDSKQLGGKNSTSSACKPQEFRGNQGSQPGLPNDGKVNPCGLIAWSEFNDTFTASANGISLPIDESDIAWHYDRDHLYGDQLAENYNNLPPIRGGGTITGPLNQNQHFMVWMRPTAAKTVRKLYGIIQRPIAAGAQVRISVRNQYNTYGFSGKKYVVLSENSWVGGKNNFLGIVFIVLGALAFLVAISFFVAYQLGVVKNRKFGDLADVSWNKIK